jgi:hypothetical protein
MRIHKIHRADKTNVTCSSPWRIAKGKVSLHPRIIIMNTHPNWINTQRTCRSVQGASDLVPTTHQCHGVVIILMEINNATELAHEVGRIYLIERYMYPKTAPSKISQR